MDELIIIENKIYEIRGQKVMLDFDLAEMYEIETKNLNKAVKRNIERFPEDFMFQLTDEEAKYLISDIKNSHAHAAVLYEYILRHALSPFRLHRTRRRHALRHPAKS